MRPWDASATSCGPAPVESVATVRPEPTSIIVAVDGVLLVTMSVPDSETCATAKGATTSCANARSATADGEGVLIGVKLRDIRPMRIRLLAALVTLPSAAVAQATALSA